MLAQDRLAIVAGARTPQAKAFGALAEISAVQLGIHAVRSALAKAALAPEQVDEVVLGNVAGPPDATNIARVIALQTGVPQASIAHTVNRNCASGMQALVDGWQAVHAGRAEIVVAGGTESMSNIPMLVSGSMQAKLFQAARAKGWWRRGLAYARVRPADFRPVLGVELGLTDPTCGLNMGQTAQLLADEFSISREEQDRFAVESHRRAIAAAGRCFMSGEISPLTIHGKELKYDVGPRDKQSIEQLAKLRPIFSADGSVTAGNSCPLTDGATALVLMSEAKFGQFANNSQIQRQSLGFVSHYSIAGCDPRRMGLGPVFATAKLLDQTGLKLNDFELIEINEAFAAQVLACMRAFDSPKFAREFLGRDTSLGQIDPEKLNIHGGAIALGHPVGSSGARLVLTLLRALRERGLRRGLATLCVGGGQGFAMVVETV
jgi:acetyl-CoA acetyltransferase family protein